MANFSVYALRIVMTKEQMMTIENIVSKVQKLLRLSAANNNAEEAC